MIRRKYRARASSGAAMLKRALFFEDTFKRETIRKQKARAKGIMSGYPAAGGKSSRDWMKSFFC